MRVILFNKTNRKLQTRWDLRLSPIKESEVLKELSLMSFFPIDHPVMRFVIRDHNKLVLKPIVMGDSTNLSEELKSLLYEMQAQNEAKLVQL